MSRYGPRPTNSEFCSYFEHHRDKRPWEREQRTVIDFCEPTTDMFENDMGCIRWSLIRQGYFTNLIDEEYVVGLYHTWRDTREDLWLDGFDNADTYVATCFVKAAKRGNDIYKKRVKHKFGFLSTLEPIHFFCDEWGVKSSPMLMVALTVDTKKYTLDQAWDQIAMDLHIFETKLRQKYGVFVKLRVWEAHTSGYPHSHLVYYFLGKDFQVFEHISVKVYCRSCRKTFRISLAKSKKPGFCCKHCNSRKLSISEPSRSWRLSGVNKDAIAGMWPMGNVDIQAVQDTIGGFSEVQKYVTKTIWSKKADLTNAMLSLHNKQSYWVSTCNPWVKFEYAVMHNIIKPTPEACMDYLCKNIDKWVRKDFVGAIWGKEAYMQLYFTFSDGLAQPTVAALVKSTMHNCNEAFPEIEYFVYQGTFLHSDIKAFLPDADNRPAFWAEPPDELRAHLGLIRPSFSPKQKRPWPWLRSWIVKSKKISAPNLLSWL